MAAQKLMTWLACGLAAAALIGHDIWAARAEAPMDGGLLRAPDHVLVWSQSPGAAEREFESMGFFVRPGQTYPEGITSSTIVFGDWSYLELLHFAEPDKAKGDPQAEAELAFVSQGPGANSVAIQVRDIEAAAAFLAGRGFAIGDLTPDMVDPDGPSGPEPLGEASWRDFHFARSPVAGVELFFIAYPPDPPSTAQADARFKARSTHANGAASLSAVWISVPDLEAEADIYRRMGFAVGEVLAADMPGGSLRTATLGGGAVVLVQLAQLPDGYAQPGRPGARIIGVSVEVSSLPDARRAIGERSRLPQAEVSGPFGAAVRIQASQALGFFVDFHEAP